MSDNETFVFSPPTPQSTDNTNSQFEEIRDLLRSAAFSINSFGERLGFMELRLAAVEAIRSNRTSKAGTPIRSPSPKNATDENKKDDLNVEDIYSPKTPDLDANRETSVGSLLKLGGIFTKPNPLRRESKDKDSKNNKSNNETQQDKFEKKREANKKNTRDSILQHDKERLKLQYDNKNTLSNAVPKVSVQHVPEFKLLLEKLEPTPLREFTKAIITHEKKYDTKLPAGTYVANYLVKKIIDKNKSARTTGKNFVSEIEDEFEFKDSTMEELTQLIRVAVAPLDKGDYEEELRKYVKDGIYIRSGYHPRIFDFQSFSDNFCSYLEKFEDVITFLSGSDIVLPMIAKKGLDGVDSGSVEILYEFLPKHYAGKYLKQYVPYVPEEKDDIISYLKRLRETHFKKGYNFYEPIRAVSKSLVKDYPYSSNKYTKDENPSVKTIAQKNKPGGHFPSKDRVSNLQNLLEETQANEELSPEESLYQQEIILEQHINRELEDGMEEFDAQLQALSLPQTTHKPIFDSKTGKSYVPKGCQNLILYDTCFLHKNGTCKNSHDVKNVRETAMIMLDCATKYLAATDPKKSTGGQPTAYKKPSLNNFGSAETGGEENSSNNP